MVVDLSSGNEANKQELVVPELVVPPMFTWEENGMPITDIASSFYREGEKQLDLLVLGERAAKLATMANWIVGGNIVYVGAPGGGKTDLSRLSYRIIYGIKPTNISIIPHHSDLTPTETVGGEVASTKTISSFDRLTDDEIEMLDDPEFDIRSLPPEKVNRMREKVGVWVAALVGPETIVLNADEINRINPFAVDALLDAYANHQIHTTAGTLNLAKMEIGQSTMNPAAGMRNTRDIDPATASRHDMGVIMGGKLDTPDYQKERQDRIVQILGPWKKQPELMVPIIDLSTLHKIRAISETVTFPDPLKIKVAGWIAETLDALRSPEFRTIDESDGRFSFQLQSTARAISLLRGNGRVEENDAGDALFFTTASRLGMLARSAYSQTAKLHKSVTGLDWGDMPTPKAA